MKINLVDHVYYNMDESWQRMYDNVIPALQYLGHDVYVGKSFRWLREPSNITKGLCKNTDFTIFNHTFPQKITETQPTVHFGKHLFLKPTAPSANHFCIDDVGYACASSITYDKPDFESINADEFYNTQVREFISNKSHKWEEMEDDVLKKRNAKLVGIPDHHILVIGQMGGDETVKRFSFGNHYSKLVSIVDNLLEHSMYPIVVKLHPYMKERQTNFEKEWAPIVDKWITKGAIVITDHLSIYNVLPKTRVAIAENSTCGVECLMHKVPIISYGYPEYHWVTFDMRHLTQVIPATHDLSWYDEQKAMQWLTWYCTQYQCHDVESTVRRFQELGL
jgi:hypothetical protein